MHKANLEIDESYLLSERVRLLQLKTGLRAGLDAVMLAASVPAKSGEKILDLGCGTGGAGLCVLGRVPDACLTGFDIQDDLIGLARQSAILNKWECDFIVGDVRDKSALPLDHFDHALCNPPYLQAGTWYDTPDQTRSKQLGKKDGDAVLQDWIDCLQRVIKPSGTISIIHRADHADKIIQALGTRFGGMEIWPLYPHEGEAASRIIIRALKNRKSPAIFHPGIILHTRDGLWTGEAKAILESAESLSPAK
ncbi:MAG TPA: methyltransferase domain-containing protein [Alphaproteobacteria bacterium]